jgi:membrane protein implicated in regulation of membrane protease activity
VGATGLALFAVLLPVVTLVVVVVLFVWVFRRVRRRFFARRSGEGATVPAEPKR